eukprot:7225280-Pyramimonas_sp.AAC.1
MAPTRSGQRPPTLLIAARMLERNTFASPGWPRPQAARGSRAQEVSTMSKAAEKPGVPRP